MNRLLDLDHPFFRPLWLRIALTLFILGWGLFEAAGGAVFWAVLFLALGAYCAWGFFVTFNPRDPEEGDTDD